MIQNRVESLRSSPMSISNDNFKLDLDEVVGAKMAWARDSYDPKLHQNEPGKLV